MKEKFVTKQSKRRDSLLSHDHMSLWVDTIFDPFLDAYTLSSLSCTSRFFSARLKASRDKKTLWQITPGYEQTLILNRKTSELYGVGINEYYSLGVVNYPARDVVKIPHRDGVKVSEIFVGYRQSFILYEDGILFATGRNSSNELGPVYSQYELPFRNVCFPNGLKPVQVAVMGSLDTLFLTRDKKLYSYKKGILSLPENKTPIYITAGFQHALILCEDNTVYGFGRPNNYQLGRFNGDISSAPQLIDFSKKIQIKKILASGDASLFFTPDNKLYLSGLLMQKNPFKDFQPVVLPKDVDIKSVYAGENHIIVQSTDNKLYGIGSNKFGQLGLGKKKLIFNFTEIILPTKSQIYYVITGYEYTFVVCEHNEIYGFGYASFQLGAPSGTCDFWPRRLDLLDAIQKLTALSVKVAEVNNEPQLSSVPT